MHFPYDVACAEQVVVECKARRLRGVLAVVLGADCMIKAEVKHIKLLPFLFHFGNYKGQWHNALQRLNLKFSLRWLNGWHCYNTFTVLFNWTFTPQR
jgi:hypothetical protein